MYSIRSIFLAAACRPIIHAANKPRTVLFADPLGARIDVFAPPIPIRHSESLPVHNSLCHSNICLAGGFPIAVQNAMKLSLAANTCSEGGLLVTFVAVINADRLYANEALAIAIFNTFSISVTI